MTMQRIGVKKLKEIAAEYQIHPCRIKGTEVINIRKRRSDRYEDITWEEFERILKKRKLAVFKATESDFIKIMKDRR